MKLSDKQRSFHVRFTMPHAGASIEATHDDGEGGIVLLAERHGGAGRAEVLALLVDLDGLGIPNPGASATNAVVDVVCAYRATIAHVLDVPESAIRWAELDSMGNFDAFEPNGKSSECTHVTWSPINPEHRVSRTMGAFLQRFPITGSRAIARLESIAHKDLAAKLNAPVN